MNTLRTALRAAALVSVASTGLAVQAPTWFGTYDGPAHYDDYAADVAVDSSGNVYTTGFVYVSPSVGFFVPQFITLKYSAQGQLLWWQQYGSGYYNGNGNATHIDFAPNGDVIVAGARDLGRDWVVASYSPSGTTNWVTIWQAASWFVSAPDDMEIDAQGNVFLCGDIGDPLSGNSRAALIRLDANGAIAWTRLYDGTGSSLATVRDMALAPSGDIYLTGGRVETNSSTQFNVVKVDSTGTPVWIRSHGQLSLSAVDYGTNIALGPSGEVVATGVIASNTAQGSGITTIAYDSAGTQLWRTDYNPTAFLNEYPRSLVVDSGGDAIVGGQCESANGDYDALVLKVGPAGLAWTHTSGGTAFLDDGVNELRLDALGRVFVVGERVDTANEATLDVLTTSGTLVLSRSWSGPYGASSRVDGMDLGPNGEVVIVGSSYAGPATRQDIFTAVFESDAATSYCTAGVSAQGCAATMSAAGTPSASAGSGFTLTASGLDGQRQGLIFYGISGRNAQAWGTTSSLLCVKTPTQRTPAQNSGGTIATCSGSLVLDWNAFVASSPSALGVPFAPGAVVDAQGWYRDPPSSKSTALSDAIEFVVQP